MLDVGTSVILSSSDIDIALVVTLLAQMLPVHRSGSSIIAFALSNSAAVLEHHPHHNKRLQGKFRDYLRSSVQETILGNVNSGEVVGYIKV